MKTLIRRFGCAAALTAGIGSIQASDLVDVIPLTPTVIALHFDDGYVKYHGYHEDGADDVVVSRPLDIRRATHLYAYNILSGDDPAYSEGRNPLRTGRKSKPTAISDSCIWNASVRKCQNDYVLEHWIYMELPSPLQRGNTYTIWMGSLADNMDQVTFRYDEFFLRSEMVHVNQHGYVPSAEMKFGYLAHWAGDFGAVDLSFLEGNDFYLVRMSDHSVAYQGTVGRRRGLEEEEEDFGSPLTWGATNNFYGSDVWEADFSAFDTPGEYRLVVEGVGSSFPFRIDPNAYREAYYYTARGLYFQRAGIAKEAKYAGKWAKPRDHHPADGLMKLYHTTYPSILAGEGSESRDEILENVVGEITGWGWGWYHDAGDWDGYVHHTEVPYILLSTYELAPENFSDNELNIPESGNGIPDILDEAGWLIRYFSRNQQPDGGIAGGRVNSDFNSKPDASPSYEDERPWYVCGSDPYTSYLFAGLAAQYAFCLELAGVPDSTPELLQAAESAYEWAGNNHQTAPGEEVKGANLEDLRMYAAAGLYKLTGEARYQDAFTALNRVDSEVAGLTGGGYNQTKAVWTYITTPDHPNIDSGLKSRLTSAAVRYARSEFLEPAEKRSARVGYSWNMPAVVGSTTTPRNLAAMFAFHVSSGTDRQEFLGYMQTTADYFLGNNPLNMSWITGLGDRHPERMLHLDSRYDPQGIDENIPGLVPYGPMRNGDHFNGTEDMGPWDADFAKVRSYPDRFQWPVSEFWFDSPYSVLDGEFTVHQTNAPAASSYGFLSADSSVPFQVNLPPSVNLLSPASDGTADEADSLILEVDASDDRGLLYVEYYLDHHPVHLSLAPPFDARLAVRRLPTGTFRVRVRAVDREGMEAWAEGPQITLEHNYTPLVVLSTGSDTLSEGQSVDVAVDVSAVSGASAAEVRLVLNGKELGRDTSVPYDFTIDSIYPLFNEIRAVVRFEEGFESQSTLLRYATPGVAGVSVKKKALEIYQGEYELLEAEVFPAEAVNTGITYLSLADSIASVNDGGRVRGEREGETRIVVTTNEGGFTDTANVTVLPPRPRGSYTGSPVVLPALIEAEHYDFGGEGIAYHDQTPGNQEDVYRFEDVDVGESYDGAPAYHVTAINPGEWLRYTVYAPEENLYDFRFRYTAGSGQPRITLLSDGLEIKTLTLPEVGWYPFKDYLEEGIPLKEGEQVLEIRFENGLMTLNFMEILCADCSRILPERINLNYHELHVAVGGTVQLRAALLPAETSNKEVLWHTPDDTILYLDPAGRVTALREGTTWVAAESVSRGLTDTCHVTVVSGSAFTPGMNYEYFEGEWDAVPEFSTLTPVATGNLPNFDLSPAQQEDNFGFRFFGEISIHVPGEYSFFTASDDGSMLYLDGVLVVDNDGLHATVEQGGTVLLDSGRHQIEVHYFEKGGGSVLDVSYEGPGIPKSAIPDSILGTEIVGGELVALQGLAVPSRMQVPAGSRVPLPVAFTPENASDREITASSSDSSVAYLDGRNYVTGVLPGEAEIGLVSRDGGYSDTVTVRVVNDIPQVQILEPGQDQVFADTAAISVHYSASDTIGGITNRMLYLDGILEQESAEPADHFTLAPLEQGTYEVSVTVTDAFGTAGESAPVVFSVEHVEPTSVTGSGMTDRITVLPNPFDQVVRFRGQVRREGILVLAIFDMAGAQVHLSGPHTLNAGGWELEWDGRNAGNNRVPAGTYHCRFQFLFGDGPAEVSLPVIRK